MKRFATGLAALALAVPAAAQETQAAADEPRVLAVVAHPDDEVIFAPVLSSLRAEGADVSIVYATSGDAGPGVSDMEKGEELAQYREGEALCASETLGLGRPVFWRLGDGTLGTNAHHPGSPAQRFLEQLEALVEKERPDLVFTWGPDGGYGHADHRMVGALVAQVLQRLDAPRPILLYAGIPKGTKPAIPQLADWGETAPELLDVTFPYSAEDLAAAARAVQCHRSQFDAETRAGLIPLFHTSIWRGKGHFRYAFPVMSLLPLEPPETVRD